MRWCLALALLLSPPVLAGNADPPPVMTPSEVKPGSAGVCLTEMEGGELVEIPLTVLGVLGGATPEGEIVLIRLEAERFRQTGIIAGMSAGVYW